MEAESLRIILADDEPHVPRPVARWGDGDADEPPTIEEVCRAAETSRRTLNYAFSERFDVTPKQYLLAVRMQRVRRDLVLAAPANKVSEIAANWGFWHMGKFAADYRRQFGELPSQTLKRRIAG